MSSSHAQHLEANMPPRSMFSSSSATFKKPPAWHSLFTPVETPILHACRHTSFKIDKTCEKAGHVLASSGAQDVENHKSLPLAFSEISAWLGTTGGCTSSSVHVDQSIMRSIHSWRSRTWTSSTSAFTRFRPRPCKPLNSTIKENWKVWDVQIARAPVVSLAAVAVLGLEAPSPWLMPQNTPVHGGRT